MKFDYRYYGASTASHSATSSTMSFTPDTLRQPTFFVGELNQHINFREAMSALHHVVVSDLRLQPKNRDDYFAWLKAEETNMLAELASESQAINAEVKALRAELATIRTEKNKVMQPFYKAQNEYFQYLYKNDYNAWFVLDPVITVHPDSVFFECFSQDESSYGKLSCNLSVFKNVQEFACGTTNIDYSAELYNEFQKIRDYKTTMFNIDPSGFEVQTTNEENFVEEKIDLPDSWVRGFLQVSSAMSLPSARFSLHPMDMYNFLFVLKQKKERHGPRSIRFQLTPDRPVVAIFGPWNKKVECKRSIYKGKEATEIRIWGRRRLMLLERLIPISKAFHVHLVGSGLPSFFEAEMQDMTFTLGLSGWTANDWAKVSNFDLMAPRGEADALTCERVFSELKRYWYATTDLLARATGFERSTVLSALTLLTQSGKVIYDLTEDVYRCRELSREPLPMDKLRFSSEREQHADNFINANLVSITQASEHDGKLKLDGTVMDNAKELAVSMVLDADERLVGGECRCHYYVQNQLRKGPCEHMLALRRFYGKQENKQAIEVFSQAPFKAENNVEDKAENLDGAKNSTQPTKKTLFPKNKRELIRMINAEIKAHGNNCSLNHIDTSQITDMSDLFNGSQFNGDISQWDVSNVTNMCSVFRNSAFNGNISHWNISNVTIICCMFKNSLFNGDISQWDTSSVDFMGSMFEDNPVFNQDISQWDVSKVHNFSDTFANSVFNQDISKWDVSSARNMESMFKNSQFNQDISAWDVSNVTDMTDMFTNCPFNYDLSKWAKQPPNYTYNPQAQITEKTLFPNEYELMEIIEEEIAKNGNNCSLNHIDTSKITDMSSVFFNSQFNGDISQWDVSNVENMSFMFGESAFNGDISQWNVSNVKDMSFMFNDSPFNQDISNWDVSNVTDMSQMFDNSPFNQDISQWNVSSVTDMFEMFRNSQFNQDISAWNVSNVENMDYMFTNSPFHHDLSKWAKQPPNYTYNPQVQVTEKTLFPKNRDELEDMVHEEIAKNGDNCNLNHIDTSKITDMSSLFESLCFNGDISEWDVSNVKCMDSMFENCSFNQDISQWDVSSVTDMFEMFRDSQFNQDISNWDVSNVICMPKMFKNCSFNQDLSKWAKQPPDYTYNPQTQVTEKTLFPKNKRELIRMINAEIKEHGNNCSLNHIDTSQITDMRELFNGSQFNGDISQWDVSNVKKMCSMFAHSAFNGDISQWNIAKVTCICAMFKASAFNGDISQWDTSSVTFMGSVFEDNRVFNQDISQWNVSNVDNFSDMFNNSVFNQDISQWDVSNAYNMNDMFRNSQFNQDISNWDVSNVYTMANMFTNSAFNQDLSKWAKQPDDYVYTPSNSTTKKTLFPKDKYELMAMIEEEIDKNGNECSLNHIDVSKITDMRNLFNCSEFNGDISQWDVSNVEDMGFLFQYTPFNQDISAWNVSKVKAMDSMFSDSQFNQDISKWDVSNVEDMSNMFNACPFNNDISKWNVSNVRDMSYMFFYSEFNQDISAWDVSNVENMDSMFNDSEFNQDISKWAKQPN